MGGAGIPELSLYPENRACKAPTATRVIEIFGPLCAHDLTETGNVLKSYGPSLSELHRQILDLPGVPVTTYQAARTTLVLLGRYPLVDLRKGRSCGALVGFLGRAGLAPDQ